MLPNEIAHWDALARQGFSYKSDGAIDTWRTHADDVLAGRSWQDDCDGLAETALDLCVRAGLSDADGYRLAVFASSDGSGHMVGCVTDSYKTMWIVGDTFADKPYLAGNMRHKPDMYNRLSEYEWRGGAPWKLV